MLPQKKNIPFFILRAVLGTAGLVSNFYAVSHLALADASILAKLAPFFTIFFSFLFLKERIRFTRLLMAVCAFTASLLIIKPAFAGSGHIFAASIACIGGLCAGGAYTCVRYLLTHKESGSFIVFFFSAVSMLILLPFFLYSFEPMSLQQLFWLLAAGAAGAGGQFTVTAAYSYAPAKNIAVFGQREGVPLKPDPAGVFEILKLLHCQKQECLYIGDTAVDIQTGKSAGLTTVGVLWGFRDRSELEGAGATHIIAKPAELLPLATAIR